MLAPFATLAFLIAAWVAAKAIIDMAAEDGAKIVAALRGRSLLCSPPLSLRPVSVRYQPRAGSARRQLRATPEWRAAA